MSLHPKSQPLYSFFINYHFLCVFVMYQAKLSILYAKCLAIHICSMTYILLLSTFIGEKMAFEHLRILPKLPLLISGKLVRLNYNFCPEPQIYRTQCVLCSIPSLSPLYPTTNGLFWFTLLFYFLILASARPINLSSPINIMTFPFGSHYLMVIYFCESELIKKKIYFSQCLYWNKAMHFINVVQSMNWLPSAQIHNPD